MIGALTSPFYFSHANLAVALKHSCVAIISAGIPGQRFSNVVTALVNTVHDGTLSPNRVVLLEGVPCFGLSGSFLGLPFWVDWYPMPWARQVVAPRVGFLYTHSPWVLSFKIPSF